MFDISVLQGVLLICSLVVEAIMLIVPDLQWKFIFIFLQKQKRKIKCFVIKSKPFATHWIFTQKINYDEVPNRIFSRKYWINHYIMYLELNMSVIVTSSKRNFIFNITCILQYCTHNANPFSALSHSQMCDTASPYHSNASAFFFEKFDSWWICMPEKSKVAVQCIWQMSKRAFPILMVVSTNMR